MSTPVVFSPRPTHQSNSASVCGIPPRLLQPSSLDSRFPSGTLLLQNPSLSSSRSSSGQSPHMWPNIPHHVHHSSSCLTGRGLIFSSCSSDGYSERPFIRSGDIRSEPPCLWEFKISKAPYPPAKISTSLAQGRRALNLPACRLYGRQANGRRAMRGLRPSGAGRPRFSQTPTPAPNALVHPSPSS